jgi:hypothetical protein
LSICFMLLFQVIKMIKKPVASLSRAPVH